jgi:hypothetical protein
MRGQAEPGGSASVVCCESQDGIFLSFADSFIVAFDQSPSFSLFFFQSGSTFLTSHLVRDPFAAFISKSSEPTADDTPSTELFIDFSMPCGEMMISRQVHLRDA